MSCTKIFQNLKNEMMENFSSSFIRNDENSYFLAIGRPIPWSRNPLEEVSKFDENFYIPYSLTGTNLETDESSLFSRFYYLLGDDSVFPPSSDTELNKSNFYTGNIFIKRILPENFSFLIKKHEWSTGQIYDAYRDDVDLHGENKRFFVYNTADKGVYKCLDNNNGARSLVAPEETFSENDFRLSDGYVWKLMYKISSTDESNFTVDSLSSTVDSFIPVKFIDYNYDLSTEESTQYDIQTSAVANSIDFVDINPNYENHITFDPIKCVVDENLSCSLFNGATAGSYVVDIIPCENLMSHPSSVNPTDYLKDLVFNVVSGPGAGQRRIISTSKLMVNTSGLATTSAYVRLTLEDPLDVGLSSVAASEPSYFTIEPRITVVGDGQSLSGSNSGNSYLKSADFRPLFEETSPTDSKKTLKYIQVMDRGKGYTNIKAFFSSGITHYYPVFSGDQLSLKIEEFNKDYENLLRPVLPPSGGHGSNAPMELGCANVLFKANLESTESGKLPATNDFRQIALLKNPLLNEEIIQLRFSDTGSAGITMGASVTASGSVGSGKIIKVTNFGTDVGHEIYVSGISGSFEGATTVSVNGSSHTVDPYDGYKRFTIAGTENKNLLKLKVSGVGESEGPIDTGSYLARDVLVGMGDRSKGIYPSYATGTIRSYQTVGTEEVEFTLESVKGRFNIGEMVGCLRKPTSGDAEGDFVVFGSLGATKSSVDSYRYSQDNFRESYSVTTKIVLDASGEKNFNETTFFEDQPIYSFDDDGYPQKLLSQKVIASGHIFAWELTSSVRVTLYVVGTKKNKFRYKDHIPYGYRSDDGTLIYGTIREVTEADVRYDSGEVMQIQNLKPIKRSESSKEEKSLVLGI